VGHLGDKPVYTDRPHEQHDIIPPLFEDDLPDGMTAEKWQAICRLVSAAPTMYLICQKLMAMSPNCGVGLKGEDRLLLKDARRMAFACEKKIAPEHESPAPGEY
jgi:hypothetical protein